MTGPHLTPEREADPVRDALVASTVLLSHVARFLLHGDSVFPPGTRSAAERIDAQVQANQVALQLATADADKPHHGTDGR